MPKKKKKKGKVDDGLTLAQRIELKKKQKDEKPAEEEPKPSPKPEEPVAGPSTQENEEAGEDGGRSKSQDEGPDKEGQNLSQDRANPQHSLNTEPSEDHGSVMATGQSQRADDRAYFIARQKSLSRNEDFRNNSLFPGPQESLDRKHNNVPPNYLPPAVFLPEPTYTSRRAYQVFCRYHNHIDSISDFVEKNLKNIIVVNSQKYGGTENQNNSGAAEDKNSSSNSNNNGCGGSSGGGGGENETQLLALQSYLLSESMQLEMDKYLADL